MECGAGEGNRTLAASLEGWSSTIEQHPHVRVSLLRLTYDNIKKTVCQVFFYDFSYFANISRDRLYRTAPFVQTAAIFRKNTHKTAV